MVDKNASKKSGSSIKEKRAAKKASAETTSGMEKLTHGEFGPGTKFRETRKFFGKTASEVFEVVAADPPRRVTLSVDGKATTTWKKGDARYIGRGVAHESKNTGGKPVDFVQAPKRTPQTP